MSIRLPPARVVRDSAGNVEGYEYDLPGYSYDASPESTPGLLTVHLMPRTFFVPATQIAERRASWWRRFLPRRG